MKTFSEFMHERVGLYWVKCRRTPKAVEKYGEVSFLSEKRYSALRAEWLATLPKCGACGQLTAEARVLTLYQP